jgi:signal transduction histidine kinase/ligand-binding sensor domain-containing protein
MPARTVGFILALMVLFHASVTAQTQSLPRLQVGHDFWGFKENAPQGTTRLAQTTDGFLWLGTPIGLYRFDGTRFELFHSPFGDELLSTNVFGLLALKSGGLWIGYTFGGFSFLNNGRVTNYGGEIASLTGTVWGFAHRGDGTIWAATSSGLWKFEHSRWRPVGSEANAPSGPVAEVGFDQEGTLWTLSGTSSGPKKLLRRQRGSDQFQMVGDDLVVAGFTLDADGNVVTNPESNPFSNQRSGGSGVRLATYPVFRKGSSQIVDRANGVWIIPPEPVVLRADASGRLSDVVREASPKNSQTYDLNPEFGGKLVDREGSIWFGDYKGIHRFFYSPLVKQELPETVTGLVSFNVVSVDDGAVWITAGNHGGPTNLCYVANGRVKLLQKSPGDLLSFAYRSSDKTLWMGGAEGLWRLVDANLVRVDLPKEMAGQSAFLQTITRDRGGGMWVSFGRHGLYRLAQGVWTSYGGREDLPKTGVVIEFTDSLGRVWFGYTKSQLAVLDDDHVQVFGPNDGIRVGNITSIYGRGAEIWIGGEFGLQQFDHGRFNSIQATDSELLRGISGIVETANGDLWLNGLGGIFHVRRSEISEALKNPAYQIRGDHFGTREGLPGFPFQLRPLNSAVEGTDGRIWFATSGGVVWFDPAHGRKSVPTPPITIQAISADDKTYQVDSELKFPAHTSSVQIRYAAISLSAPTAVHFRYKLKETDKDWHEVASAGPVSYRNLAPGSYHFSVAATDTNGVWSDKVATAEFAILPAFYQTRWFLVLCIAAALTALYFVYLLRLTQVARQFRARMDERVNERTRIARELHDTLLQNLHGLMFEFQAARNMFQKRPEEALQALDGAIMGTEQAITESQDAIEALRSPATEDLAQLINITGEDLAASRSGDHDSPTFALTVEGQQRVLAPVIRDEVYRIAREVLRNAFRHSQARRIEAEILYDEDQLRLRVRDDGKGMDPQVLEKGRRPGHWGLQGVRERAQQMGAKLDVWSETGAGTEVQLAVAASVAYQKRSRRSRFKLFQRTRNRD